MTKSKVIHVLFFLAISILVFRCGVNGFAFLEVHLPQEEEGPQLFSRSLTSGVDSIETVVRSLFYWAIGMVGFVVCLRLRPLQRLPIYALLVGFAKLVVLSTFSSAIYDEWLPVGLLVALVSLIFFMAVYANVCRLLPDSASIEPSRP